MHCLCSDDSECFCNTSSTLFQLLKPVEMNFSCWSHNLDIEKFLHKTVDFIFYNTIQSISVIHMWKRDFSVCHQFSFYESLVLMGQSQEFQDRCSLIDCGGGRQADKFVILLWLVLALVLWLIPDSPLAIEGGWIFSWDWGCTLGLLKKALMSLTFFMMNLKVENI